MLINYIYIVMFAYNNIVVILWKANIISFDILKYDSFIYRCLGFCLIYRLVILFFAQLSLGITIGFDSGNFTPKLNGCF